MTVHKTSYSPGSSGAASINSCMPSLSSRSQPLTLWWSLVRNSVNPWMAPSRFQVFPLRAMTRRITISRALTVISALFCPAILNRLSLSASTSITWDCANAGAAATRTMAKTAAIINRTRLFPMLCLLRHVTHDQAHILIGDSSAHAHVPHDRSHHPRWKLGWRRMATPTVGTKALLAFGAHVFVLRGCRRSRRAGRILGDIFVLVLIAGAGCHAQQHTCGEQQRGNGKPGPHSAPPCGHIGMTKR